MVEKKGIQYCGIWDFNGRFYTLDEPSTFIPDWDRKEDGDHFEDSYGNFCVEVEYNPYDQSAAPLASLTQ